MFFQLRQKEFCSIGPWSIPLTTWRSLSGEIIDKMKFPKNFRVSLSNVSLPASDVIGEAAKLSRSGKFGLRTFSTNFCHNFCPIVFSPLSK